MTIDIGADKTHLTSVNAITRLSSKGQVVIPKDVREALGWPEGKELLAVKVGDKVVLEPSQPDRERISWEEFRRRVPRHEGQPISIEQMDAAVAKMFADRHKQPE